MAIGGTSKGLVLVTGANGYIGAKVVGAFLAAGYSVRGTVRSPKSATALLAALASYTQPQSVPHFEIAEVPDITVPNAFAAALKGVTAVAHLATPVSLFSTDADYVVNTSVKGALSILESAMQEPSIKHFVLMSSITSVVTYGEDRKFTEADWNQLAEKVVAEKGDAAGGPLIYSASKVAAERAFWKIVDEKKPSFTATALNPTFVAGPPLAPPKSPSQINETNEFIWQVLSGEEFPPGPTGYGGYVDVRDVARMTVFAVERADVANGQRYIVGGNGNVGNPQAVADILRKAYPGRRDIIKVGTPGQGYLADYSAPEGGRVIVSDKAVEATGQNWIPYDQMVRDAAASFEPLLNKLAP